MSADAKDLCLRNLFPFVGLGEDKRRSLASVALIRDYEKGVQIFSEGDAPDFLFAVVKGRAKVVKTAPNGSEIILEIFGPGDPLGAVAVFKEFPYPASAVAMVETRCALVPRLALFRLLAASPQVARGLLAILTRRLVVLTNRLTELSGGRVEARLARIFLKFADQLGETQEGTLLIPLRLTRQEVADLTGVTVETCIRVLSKWSRNRILRTGKNGFVVENLPALNRLAAT